MDSIHAITENAAQHITWALSLIAGTLLTIIGTSHTSPKAIIGRFIYFLFLPAWVLLALSIYYGDQVQRHAITIGMVSESVEIEVHRKMNSAFACQLDYLMLAGSVLGIWLVLYVVWWVICRE